MGQYMYSNRMQLQDHGAPLTNWAEYEMTFKQPGIKNSFLSILGTQQVI